MDGGGNIGLTAAYLATRYPAAEIVSIEPDPGNFALLAENVRPYPNVVPLQAGVWHRSASLAVKDTGGGANAFTVEETDAATPGAVRAVGLADLLAERGWPRFDLVKLDVEGAEREIFSGDVDAWLSRTRVLVVELHDRMRPGCAHAVLGALARRPFSMSVQGENLVFRLDPPSAPAAAR